MERSPGPWTGAEALMRSNQGIRAATRVSTRSVRVAYGPEKHRAARCVPSPIPGWPGCSSRQAFQRGGVLPGARPRSSAGEPARNLRFRRELSSSWIPFRKLNQAVCSERACWLACPDLRRSTLLQNRVDRPSPSPQPQPNSKNTYSQYVPGIRGGHRTATSSKPSAPNVRSRGSSSIAVRER